MNRTAFIAELIDLAEREAISYGIQSQLGIKHNDWGGCDLTTGGRVCRFTFEDDTVEVLVFSDARLILEARASFVGMPAAVVSAALNAHLFS